MNFEVNREDFGVTRFVPAHSPQPELTPGQIRLAVERFAVTTNNITYAVAGDMLDYWGFFPTDAPWGRLPVMGLASVADSANPDIAVGGRYFGFFPMTDSHLIEAQVRRDGFRDVGAHRANHAAAYTTFTDVTTDLMFQPDQPDEYLLLRGLFTTSFLVDDYLSELGEGPQQTLVTSASSKTSISLASCLARRADQHCIGLTSERNRSFVESLNLYDQVVTYDEVGALDPEIPSAMVDMAGSASVRSDLHHHFGDRMVVSLAVGITHREDGVGGAPQRLPGATPEFFFAPTQIAKRSEEWGAEELNRRIAESFHDLLGGCDSWLTVEHHNGADGIEHVYRSLLDGRATPDVGYIVFPEVTS